MADGRGQNSGATPAPAWRAAATRNWTAYFDQMEGKPARDTLIKALETFELEGVSDAADPSKTAIDLGCGSGRDTVELLSRGWSVDAIDGTPEALQRLLVWPGVQPSERLTIRLLDFARLTTLKASKLVNASFSLPFCPPEHFERVWDVVLGAVEPGGRFSGQLFGDRDSWALLPDRSHQTRDRVEAMFDGLKFERLDEEEKDAHDAEGNAKHWHVFHVVARRPR
ncbi:MAG: class I SAM-dependent methyltransferase [Planctomycetota bacterium]